MPPAPVQPPAQPGEHGEVLVRGQTRAQRAVPADTRVHRDTCTVCRYTRVECADIGYTRAQCHSVHRDTCTVCRYTRVAHVSSLPAGFRAWLGGCHGQGAGRGRAPDPQHHRGRRHQHQLKKGGHENMLHLSCVYITTDIHCSANLFCMIFLLLVRACCQRVMSCCAHLRCPLRTGRVVAVVSRD